MTDSLGRTDAAPRTNRIDDFASALVEAGATGRSVVLLLISGVRLNGLPVDVGDLGGAEFVKIRELADQEPYVVRLDHISYVRVLGRRPAPPDTR